MSGDKVPLRSIVEGGLVVRLTPRLIYSWKITAVPIGRGWMGPKAHLHVLEEREIPTCCRDSNPGFL